MDEQNKKDALGGNREQALECRTRGDRRQKWRFSYAPAATRFYINEAPASASGLRSPLVKQTWAVIP
jgi:hypothetical protein